MYCVYMSVFKVEGRWMKYIGSSSVSRVQGGYRGSISSRKWKDVIVDCQSMTRVISTWSSREDAMVEELRVQRQYDVVSSDRFLNESFAIPNGFFGRDVSSSNNPMFGRSRTGEKRSEATCRNISEGVKSFFDTVEGQVEIERRRERMLINNPMTGKHHTVETIDKMSSAKRGSNNPMFGRTHSEESKREISDATRGRTAHNKGKRMTEEQKDKLKGPKSESHKAKLRKTYIVNGVEIVYNAKLYCEEHGLNYAMFTQAAKHKRPYRGIVVETHKGDQISDKFERVIKLEKHKNFSRIVE